MGKKKTNAEDAVKFQIVVPEHVWDEISELAERIERSNAWMTEKLLEAALEDRQTVVGRFGKWLMAAAFSGLRSSKASDKEKLATKRLQVYLSPEIASQIDAMAKSMNLSSSRMAAWLVDAALDEQSFIVKVVTVPVVKEFFKSIYSRQRKKRSDAIKAAEVRMKEEAK